MLLTASSWHKPFYKSFGLKKEGFTKKGYFGADDYYFGKLVAEPDEKKFLK